MLGDQYDRTRTLLHHRFRRRGAKIKGRFEIYVEHPVERLGLEAQEERIDRLPGIGDRRNPSRPKRDDRFGNRLVDRLLVGDVAGKQMRDGAGTRGSAQRRRFF